MKKVIEGVHTPCHPEQREGSENIHYNNFAAINFCEALISSDDRSNNKYPLSPPYLHFTNPNLPNSIPNLVGESGCRTPILIRSRISETFRKIAPWHPSKVGRKYVSTNSPSRLDTS